MEGVLSGLTVIAIVVCLGYVVGRLDVIGPNAEEVLSRLSVLVATPALLFSTLAKADVRSVLSSALLVTVVSTATAAIVFVLVAGAWWRRPPAETIVGTLASFYVNASNLGIPVAVYVLGDASYMVPVLLYQVVVVTPIAFAGLDAATRTTRRSPLRVFLQPLHNPVTIACVLGLLVGLSGLALPEPVMRPIELVGAIAVPAALLVFGMSLHGAPAPGSGDTGRMVWLAVFLKSLVQPAIAYGFAAFVLDMKETALLAATLTAALPTAQNIYVYAVRYGRGTTLARDAVLLSTAACVPVLIAIATLAG